MKVAKFIAYKGWDLAQRDVVCLETGFITKADFLEHYGFEILDEMKIYVDAWELVESIGGLEFAKNFIEQTGSTMNSVLEKAIALVEEVESLKEVG